MATPIIAAQPRCQDIEFVGVSSDAGQLVLVPRVVLEAMMARGGGTITVQIGGGTGSWLSAADAARELMSDLDGLSPDAADKRVLRAARAGAFTSTRQGGSRLIEPVSFRAWRLGVREKALDEQD